MIIKTTQDLSTPNGRIVSGVAYRAQRERDGFKITLGEFNGIHVPSKSEIILSDVQVDENGNRKRGSRYD